MVNTNKKTSSQGGEGGGAAHSPNPSPRSVPESTPENFSGKGLVLDQSLAVDINSYDTSVEYKMH